MNTAAARAPPPLPAPLPHAPVTRCCRFTIRVWGSPPCNSMSWAATVASPREWNHQVTLPRRPPEMETRPALKGSRKAELCLNGAQTPCVSGHTSIPCPSLNSWRAAPCLRKGTRPWGTAAKGRLVPRTQTEEVHAYSTWQHGGPAGDPAGTELPPWCPSLDSPPWCLKKNEMGRWMAKLKRVWDFFTGNFIFISLHY